MIGDKYKLLVDCLGNSAGTCGYVFNEYQDFDLSGERGVQIIFPNGKYDGFSFFEQKEFLEFVSSMPEYQDYEFNSVLSVSYDFKQGRWKFNE